MMHVLRLSKNIFLFVMVLVLFISNISGDYINTVKVIPKPQYTSLIVQNVDGCDIYTIALSMYGRENFVGKYSIAF